MMDLRKVYEYYSREDIQNFLLNFSKDREIVGVFRNGNFSQRPNVILYPNDITAMVKTGVVEFHGSLERWSQPMSLRQDNYEQLRTGWDLIFDIDCKLFEHGRIASEAFIWGLKKNYTTDISIKYTGGTGFHIGIPWESLPKEVDYSPTVRQYPDLAKIIVRYIKNFARERFERNLLKKFSPEDLSHQVNKPLGKIFTDEGIDPYEVVNVDPILLSPRHFFRLPYSLNGKTFLVSLPIKLDELESFNRINASPEKVNVYEEFLVSHEKNGAATLVAEAIDWWTMMKAEERHEIERNDLEKWRSMGYRWIKKEDLDVFKKPISKKEFTEKTPENLFPPCIKNISAGLSDGRKRSLFVLINFLRSSNWTWEEIEKYVTDWNHKNKPPLMENMIRSHVRWSRNRNKSIPPYNCFKNEKREEGYYKDLGVCTPDFRCKLIKNPVNYALRTMSRQQSRQKPAKTARRRKAPS
jgi:DNA primase catalytic subunit